MEHSSDKCNLENPKCLWNSHNIGNGQHFHSHPFHRKKIYNNILEVVGNSPLVRLNVIPKANGVNCEILAKCDYLLPGGSCKDRIAKKMIEDAEKKGILKPGSTIIEPTSGNTGIGLAMVGAVKGYEVIITLPEKMSQEKEDILNSLGAIVIRTANVHKDDPNSHFAVAKKLQSLIPDSVILDQYNNISNPLVHYDETAEEIWDQCDGRIDYVVIGAGTGGTLTGVANKLKEKDPKIKIIGIDPDGSILALPEELNKSGVHNYKIEGIGYDFIPNTLDRSVVDKWIKTEDKESFRMARDLIKSEGMMVGGSCGSTLVGAIKLAKELNLDNTKRVVVLLVDGIRNYISKFLNDDWMLENSFITQEEYDELQKTSESTKPFGMEYEIKELVLPETICVNYNCKIEQVLALFKEHSTDCFPVINKENKVEGKISYSDISTGLSIYKVGSNDTIENIFSREVKKLNANDSVRLLQKAFLRHRCIFILNGEKVFRCEPKHLTKFFLSKNKN